MTQEEFDASVAWSRVVGACILRDEQGRFLLVQEAQPKVYGLWNLPAGHIDKGESIEDGAAREAKEETGLDVELINKIGIWHESVETPVRHAFEAKVIGGEIKPQIGEILDVKWFSYDEIVQMHESGKLRAEWIFEAITKANDSREK